MLTDGRLNEGMTPSCCKVASIVDPLGAGVFFQGQKQGDIANAYQLPGYGRVDALVKYKIQKAKTTLQFNVENLLNQPSLLV